MMNTHRLFALVLTAIIGIALFSTPTVAKRYSGEDAFSARVVEVVDGSSISIQRQSGQPPMKIHLAGIAVKQRDEARQLLHGIAFNRRVDVRMVGKKNEAMARVFLSDGTDLGRVLVNAGLAHETDGSAHPIRRLDRLGRFGRVVFGGRPRLH